MEVKIRPSEKEFETVKEIVRETVSDCQEEMPKQEELEIGIGWTEEETVLEQMGGTGAEETLNANKIVVKFNSGIENWKENFRRTVAHEYAHAVFWEETHEIEYEWEWVLFEAHGMMFAEKMHPETEAPWAEKISEEELKERWMEARKELETRSDWGSFWYGSEKWPQWFGYTLSYRIGRKLLDERDLEEFPEIEKSKVLETGDQLLRED